MIIAYVRVSRKKQDHQLQLDALEEYGHIDKIYEEKQSGRLTTETLDKLLQDVLRPGDTLVIWKLDRLNRTAWQLIKFLEELHQQGINFISLTENIDYGTPSGKAWAGMTAIFAENELNVNHERTMAGIESARKRGIVGGRPKVNEEAIKRALELHKDKTVSIAEITKLTGIKKSTLFHYLKKEREQR